MSFFKKLGLGLLALSVTQGAQAAKYNVTFKLALGKNIGPGGLLTVHEGVRSFPVNLPNEWVEKHTDMKRYTQEANGQGVKKEETEQYTADSCIEALKHTLASNTIRKELESFLKEKTIAEVTQDFKDIILQSLQLKKQKCCIVDHHSKDTSEKRFFSTQEVDEVLETIRKEEEQKSITDGLQKFLHVNFNEASFNYMIDKFALISSERELRKTQNTCLKSSFNAMSNAIFTKNKGYDLIPFLGFSVFVEQINESERSEDVSDSMKRGPKNEEGPEGLITIKKVKPN